MKLVTRKVKRLKKGEVVIPAPILHREVALNIMAKISGIDVHAVRLKNCGRCIVELEPGDEERLADLTEMVIGARNVRHQLKYEMVIPEDVRQELSGWNTVKRSPYSNSFYNVDGITWGYKPEGSLRISDHWGWEDQWEEGVRHCELADEPGYVTGWRMAEYRNGQYYTVKIF